MRDKPTGKATLSREEREHKRKVTKRARELQREEDRRAFDTVLPALHNRLFPVPNDTVDDDDEFLDQDVSDNIFEDMRIEYTQSWRARGPEQPTIIVTSIYGHGMSLEVISALIETAKTLEVNGTFQPTEHNDDGDMGLAFHMRPRGHLTLGKGGEFSDEVWAQAEADVAATAKALDKASGSL